MAKTMATSWQRDTHTTVTSFLVSAGAQKVVDFATEVLNATIMWNIPNDDKTGVKNASVRIGDTVVMVQDADEKHSAAPVWLFVYVEDVDKTYEVALQKGAVSVEAPKDECYGDRTSGVKDPAGNTWWLATHKFVPQCQSNA